MKKTVFTLLIFMVCTIQALAYEYFTIYFSDGTKSEAFYATDVDSICYSKLSLDGIAFDEWQVQEIYTVDSVYRYPLAQIDSLSFKDVDVNRVAETLDRTSSTVVPLFSQSKSISELSQSLPTIRNIEGVVDAWIDGNALSIDISDYGTITFLIPPVVASNYNKDFLFPIRRSMKSTTQNHTNIKNVCIYNHMDKDEDEGFNDSRWVTENLRELYNDLGVSCEVKTHLLPDFFVNKMFDYDHLFIITHGFYDGKTGTHWLVTDEEILCIENEQWFSHIDEFREFLNKNAIYSSNKLKILPHSETRNGKRCVVFYVAVSEHLISMSKNKFKNPNTIVFNAACQSMKGEDGNKNKLANAFIDKGASCYIGYTDNNTIGRMGGFEFFQGLLNGSCIESSYKLIETLFKEEDLYEYKSISTGQASLFRTEQDEYLYELENEYHPLMEIIRNNPQFRNLSVMTYGGGWNMDGTIYYIRGSMRKIDSDAIQAFSDYTLRPLKDKYKYGIQWSTNPDMSEPDTATVKGQYDSSTLTMNWEKTLDTSTLSPNTTYYYRAYMNDGYSDCYGEIKQFSVNDNDDEDSSSYKAYFILNDGTATFYYDDKFEERGDEVFSVENYLDPYWHHYYYDDIYKIVFDISFSKYEPTNINIKYFFYRCSKLKEIVNIRFLNTSNATSMYEMFAGCESLTTLDLSSFDTSKVVDMSYMFFNCYSLKTINFGNFNTSNVKRMHYMFECCKSLTSLDLSSFNTKNVYNMSCMFGSCHSLTDIVLSSFNTENVIDMSSMFNDCRSLKSIDVSGFNTSAVTNMQGMFAYCSSLISLNLSNFHTGQVRKMDSMFANCSSLISVDLSSFEIYNPSDDLGVDLRWMFKDCLSLKTIYAGNWNHHGENMFKNCNNLEGGQGTKLGYNIYGYDSQGNPLGYWCEDSFKAAHIDGGKDNPGLFTAK